MSVLLSESVQPFEYLPDSDCKKEPTFENVNESVIYGVKTVLFEKLLNDGGVCLI